MHLGKWRQWEGGHLLDAASIHHHKDNDNKPEKTEQWLIKVCSRGFIGQPEYFETVGGTSPRGRSVTVNK
jgi:hypothetical protein